MRRMISNRKAFSLVELLVVIGIISLLVLILLPILGAAREQSRRIQCLANLRQLDTAFLMYAHANKAYLPASSVNSGGYYNDWIFWQTSRRFDECALAPYLARFGA